MTITSEDQSHISDPTLFTIGAKVTCGGEHCGRLTRVILDPIARTLTHIVVEPRREEQGRLVPLNLVQASNSENIELSCSNDEFSKLAPSENTDYLPLDGQYGSYYRGYAQGYGYGLGGAAFWPNYGYGGTGYGTGWRPESTTYDSIPSGEVTIRRGDAVHATDGDVGHIAGLVIGTPTGEVTHVLLQEGHLWGKKDVSIPIHSVTKVSGIVQVNLSKQALEELPSIDIDHPDSDPDLHAAS
jgi:sporulation protein YlmC with PRC-barrel domain